jgi:phage gpG-like protein
MIRVQIIGAEAVIKHLGEVPPRVLGLVRQAVMAETYNVELTAEQKVSGPVLENQSGTLRRKINSKFQDSGDSIIGSVGLALVYGAIHEYGGVIRAHVIQARNKKALAFQAGGQMIVRRAVNHPGSKMPERSFLRSSLRENEARIRANIAAAVAQGVKG